MRLKFKFEGVSVEHWGCKMRKEDFSHPLLAIESIRLS
jgi:hypothetical protein